MIRALACLLPILIATGIANSAQADGQWSSRLSIGGGAVVEPGAEGVFDLALRTDVLFGAAEHDHVRVGPVLDLRTATFETAEASLGASLLLPIISGFPLVLSPALGYASRPGDLDGLFGQLTVEFGYRSYNYHASYGYGLNLYASARMDLQGRYVDVTGGIQVDLMFLVGIPSMFIWTWLTNGDPDEE